MKKFEAFELGVECYVILCDDGFGLVDLVEEKLAKSPRLVSQPNAIILCCFIFFFHFYKLPSHSIH